MTKKLLQSALIMVDIRYFYHMGNSFVKSIIQLKNNETENVYAINLLSTQAVELLAKSIIASDICFNNPMNSEKELNKNINNKFIGECGHQLDKLLNKIPDTWKKLNIQSVNRFNKTGFVDEYRIKFKNNDILIFQTLEAARYGSFSQKKDVSITLPPIEMYNFLQNFSKEASIKISEVNKKISSL